MKRLLISLLCAAALSGCRNQSQTQSGQASEPQTSAQSQTAPPLQPETVQPGAAGPQSVENTPGYVCSHVPSDDYTAFIPIYAAFLPLSANDLGILEKVETIHRNIQQEIRRTGQILLNEPDFNDPHALAVFRIKLQAQADSGCSFLTPETTRGGLSFRTDRKGQLLTAERELSDSDGYGLVGYAYFKGIPFSATVSYTPKGQTSSYYQTFINRNGRWQPLLPETALPEPYRSCAVCTQEAQDLQLQKDQIAKRDAYKRDTQTHTTAAAVRNIGIIDKRNIPELMTDGATQSSITLGYDAEGRPEKLYASHGDKKRVHSYQYYFKNGRLVSAEADTIYYHADGSIDTGSGREQKLLFDENARLIENTASNPPPERPINPATLPEETQRLIGIAEKYR